MGRLERAATYWLGFVFVVAPLKFGITASMLTVSFAPLSLYELIFEPWPVSWAPVFSGIALLLVTVDAHEIDTNQLRRSWPTWLPLLLLLAVCLIGFIRPVNYSRAISFAWHLTGAITFGLAVVIHVQRNPKARQALLACIALGMLLVAVQVSYQYFHGYKEDLRQIAYNEAHNPNFAGPHSGVIDRLKQNRPMGGFTLPNSLAGHLILVFPLLLTSVWSWARNVDPPRPSQIVLTAGTAIIFAFCLYTTKSRAAMASVAIAGIMVIIAAVVCEKEMRTKYRHFFIAAAIAIPVAAILLYVKMQDGRSLSSLYARFEYWRGAWEMFKEQPVTGFGLGEFFPNFLRFKHPGAETARLPHSIFYHFISLCGIAGGIACLFFMSAPFLLWREVVHRRLPVADRALFYIGLTGPLAWIIHSATDLNIHVPCSVMMFTPVLALLIAPKETEDAATTCCCPKSIKAAMILLAIISIGSVIRIPGDYKMAMLDRTIMLQEAPPNLLVERTATAARLNPGSIMPWLRLGGYAAHREDWTLAENCYREVVRIDPEFADGHLKLGAILTHLGKFDEAEKELCTFFYWNPHHPTATLHWLKLQHIKHQK